MEQPLPCTKSIEECEEVMEKVIQSLDGELSEHEEKILLDNLKNHACCLQKMNIARSYKIFLCHKVQRKKISATVVNGIKDRIAQGIT